MAKDQDRDKLEDGTLKEELEAYQEQTSQEWAEREWLHKVLETTEAEIVDLWEDLDQVHWIGGVAAMQNWMPPGPKSQCVKRWRTDTWTSWWTLLKEKLVTERKSAGLSLGGRSSTSESVEGNEEPPKVAEERTSKEMTLPTSVVMVMLLTVDYKHFATMLSWNSGQSDRSCVATPWGWGHT